MASSSWPSQSVTIQEESGLKERKEQLGILEAAKPAIIICTRDRARATAFYRDTLGLTIAYEDSFGAVLNIGGVTLRDLLQLAVGEKAEPLAIRREKGIACVLRTGKRGGQQLVERACRPRPKVRTSSLADR